MKIMSETDSDCMDPTPPAMEPTEPSSRGGSLACGLGHPHAESLPFKNIRAAPGQTVSLPCRAPSNTDIILVEWTRPELEPEYVFMYRDGRSDPGNQLPLFKDRVELKDREMKDGDVSTILKNVTSSDTGNTSVVSSREKQTAGRREPIHPLRPSAPSTWRFSQDIQRRERDEETGDKKGGNEGNRLDGSWSGCSVSCCSCCWCCWFYRLQKT
ncbi:hypothetical protein INR49_001171 [Caranx melampygus]|nr:hypothetical protein INR49_001171 [Caranx melampygus]